MRRLISVASALAFLGCGGGNDDGPKGGAGGGGGASGCGDVMTSAENCGTCGHSCLGGTCRAGLCQPVTLADNVKATWLAVDNDYVYASEGEWDAVVRVPKSGGSAEPIGSAATPMGITATAQGVFWSYRGSHTRFADQGAVMRVPPGSTKSEVFLQPANMPCGITADETHLYWSDQGSLATGQTDGRIRRMPLAGGQDETVVAEVGAPCLLAVDAQWVYTFDYGDILMGDTPRLVKVPKSGGAPVTLVAAIEDPRGLALDQKAVYWTNQSSDTDSISHVDSVEGVALDGSKSFKVASSERWPIGLVVDAKYAYWLTQNTELRRAPLDGSTAAVTIYSVTSDPYAIFESLAQDATALYVGVGDSDSITTGKLVKIAK